MSTEVRHRRGTTAQHAAFTGALAEITVDTDKKTAVVHDGVTVGGVTLAREDGKNDNALGYQQDVKVNDYAVVVGDIGKMLVGNKATAINFTLGTAASLTSKFVAAFKNINAGAMTITPAGAELIDGANTAITLPTGASLILKGDGTSFRTYLANGDVTASAIHNAAAKAALLDADEMGVVDTAAGNVLKKFTLANLISSIFKTARTIVNAQFDAASFKLFNAAGTPRALQFILTALTGDRTATWPDKNIDFGKVQQVTALTYQSANGMTALDWTSIDPTATEIILDFEQISATGTDALIVQLGTAGGLITSNYDAGSYFGQVSPGAASSVGFVVGGIAAARAISGKLILTKGTGNHWVAALAGGRSTGVAEGLSGGGSVDLGAPVTQMRLTRSGTNTFDSGGASGSYKV